MRLHRPSALLLGATLVLGAVATPGIAFAGTPSTTGTPTPVAASDVLAALKSAEATTASAGQSGWDEKLTASDPSGANSATMEAKYAVLEGRGYVSLSGNPSIKMIQVQSRGTYQTTPLLGSMLGAARLQRVLNAIGRPNATWIYFPDPTVDLTSADTGMTSMSPDTFLSGLVDPSATTINDGPSDTPPTQTVGADGSTTYTFDASFVVGQSVSGSSSGTGTVSDVTETGTVSVTLDASGAITRYTDDMTQEKAVGTFAYGPQHVALPAPSQVVTMEQIVRGLPLLTMAPDARKIATGTRTKVAHTSHTANHTVRVIRRVAARLALQRNGADGERVFTTRHVPHGVRIVATNPFTHAKVAYTIKAKGKRAVVRRA